MNTMNPAGVIQLIKRRREQIILHSVLYYKHDISLITDYIYDSWARELFQLQKDYPVESQRAPYYEMFKDYEGHTGFHLVFEPAIQGLIEQHLDSLIYVFHNKCNNSLNFQ